MSYRLRPYYSVPLLLLCAQLGAQEPSADETPLIHDGRHLVEMSYSYLDGFDGELEVVTAGYTYSYSRNLRFSATTQLVSVEIPPEEGPDGTGGVDELGQGDSILTVQYDPGANLTSSPWIPDRVGVFGALLLPTGDANDGLSSDAWGATLGAGWPILVSSRFMIVPSMDYTKTFEHSANAIPQELLTVNATLIWLSPYGAWLGIEPYLSWDFETHETLETYTVVLGKTFRNGLGFDLHWGTRRRFESYASRDDKVFIFNVNWQFGAPPRK